MNAPFPARKGGREQCDREVRSRDLPSRPERLLPSPKDSPKGKDSPIVEVWWPLALLPLAFAKSHRAVMMNGPFPARKGGRERLRPGVRLLLVQNAERQVRWHGSRPADLYRRHVGRS